MNIQLVSIIHSSVQQCCYTQGQLAFWKNGSITDLVLQEISNAYGDTKPEGIRVTCIVSGDDNASYSDAFWLSITIGIADFL